MERVGAMWAKLAALAAVVVVLFLVLLAPAATVRIRIDLPPAAPGAAAIPAARVDQADSIVQVVATGIVLFLVLAPAGYVAWRIVKSHKRPTDPDKEA